jgi:RNA polymerase sigma factor (sigma-70 family)
MPLGAPSNARRAGRLRPRTFLRAQRDERLVARLRSGDERAFEVLVDRYRGRLLGFCRGMLGSNEDAEDALQEVFVAAHDAIMADERDIHVRPWLYRIARNRCLNHLRRQRPETNGPLDEHLHDNGVTTEDEAERRQELRDLVAGIRALPETQRNALLLRELEALSYDEIAASLDTTVPAVKSLLVRARISLARARRQAAKGVAVVAGLAPVVWLRRWVGAKVGVGGGAGGAAGTGGGGTMAAAGAGAISTKAAAVAVGAALIGGGTAAVGGAGVPSPGAVVAAVTGSTDAGGGTQDGGAPGAPATSPGGREHTSRSGISEGERADHPAERSDSGGRTSADEDEEAAGAEETTADGSADGGTFARRERFLALRERDPDAARRLWLRIRRYREREADTYEAPAPTEPQAPEPRPRPRPEPPARPRPRPPQPPPPPEEEPAESPPPDDGETREAS